jgi:membrane protease YdiL (CAAX protease family)
MNINSNQKNTIMKTDSGIQPIAFSTSLIIFLGAGVLFLINERVVIPYLHEQGVSQLILFLTYISPFSLFLFFALYGYSKEGLPWNWRSILKRFRYRPIRGKMWIWTILIVAADVASYVLVYQLAYPFIKRIHDAFPTPEVITDFMNNGETFAGYTIQGNYWLIGLYLVLLFFNVIGEEFLWRGYLWPRQELTHGKFTWVVHGLLWTAFHLFAPYNAIMVLPGALFMSYMVQRFQNNTLFLLSHATLNGIPFVMLIINVMA